MKPSQAWEAAHMVLESRDGEVCLQVQRSASNADTSLSVGLRAGTEAVQNVNVRHVIQQGDWTFAISRPMRPGPMSEGIHRVEVSLGERSCAFDLRAGVTDDRVDMVMKAAQRSLDPSIVLPPVETVLPLDTLAHRPTDPTLDQLLVGSRQVGGVLVAQLRVSQQWHHNACGHHALFNTHSLVEALASKISSVECTWQSEEHMWTYVHDCVSSLQRHRAATGSWPATSFESGIMDVSHMEHLVATDSVLSPRARVIEFAAINELPEDVFDEPTAFLVAAVSHWISLVTATVGGQRILFVMDSFNKPIFGLNEPGCIDMVATQVIEEYQAEFVSRLRRLDAYFMAPTTVLEDAYRNGVPEYWNGKPKDALWWRHRPSALRRKLLVAELEFCHAVIESVLLALQSNQIAESKSSLALLPRVPATPLPSHIDILHTDAGHLGLLTELSSVLYRGYVRRDENVPEGSDLYMNGNALHNRKVAPPKEIDGDVFDRQRVIPGFDQGLIERQVCLVLGTGGVGQNTALALARLGVAKIILIDRDDYQASNLTRQCLGSKPDVGLPKAHTTARNLEFHNLRSKIEPIRLDALQEWGTIVDLAKGCSVVFNCIDEGVLFDFCVNSLCKELCIPLVVGQSFGWKFMIEYYSGEPGKVCAFCQETTMRSFSADLHEIQHPHGLTSRLIRHFGQMDQLSLNGLADFFMCDPKFRLLDKASALTVCGELESQTGFLDWKGPFNSDRVMQLMKAFHDVQIAKVQPGQISQQRNLLSLPRPEPTPTRFVGSWVAPCLACGALMAGHWANALTGPMGCNPPTMMVYNIDQGMTSEEQMFYDFAEAGLPSLSRKDRLFARSPSSPSCKVCQTAHLCHTRELVYFGMVPVYLAPVSGETSSVVSPADWRSPEHLRSQLTAMALKRADPLVHLGEEYANSVLPCVPALDVPYCGKTTSSSLPVELGAIPMMKLDQEIASTWPSHLLGVASGRRSALVKVKDEWYRLKGCGDVDEGFPARTFGDHGEQNVRGCLFEHTAARELRINSVLEQTLAGRLSNKSVGWYRYESQEDWDLPGIPRYCAVFQTLGDRRLGDHLLAGIEALLPYLCGPVPPSLAEAIQGGRGVDLSDQPWDTAMIVETGGRVANLLACLERKVSLEIHPPPSSDSGILSRLGVPEEMAAVWDEAREELARLPNDCNLLLYLGWRLGRECGDFLSSLHRAGISWGSFPDRLGIHCNAHANNFVVRRDQDVARSELFLAALDFDMAFEKDLFLTQGVAAAQQTLFPCDWEGILDWEHKMGMRPSLAGSDFSSTGVSNVRSDLNQDLSLVKIAFRDILVAGFDSSMEGLEDAVPFATQHVSACSALIRLALATTINCVA